MNLGAPLIREGRVDSTMAAARRLLASGAAAPGAVVVAEEQTAGRGRHGRSWMSPAGRGLYLTAVLPADLGTPALTLAAALAVAEALDPLGVDARLKWPNDVLIDGRKVAGVLAEASTDAGAAVLLGVGVNVGHTREDLGTMAETATSLLLAAGAAPDAELLLQSLLERLGTRLGEARPGFQRLVDAWRARSVFAEGDLLEVDEGGRRRVVTFSGIGVDGRLLVRETPGALASAVVRRVRRAGSAA